MADLEQLIVDTISARSYQPVKPKALARKLGIGPNGYARFKETLRSLIRAGRASVDKNSNIRPNPANVTITGIFRRSPGGHGVVRPHPKNGLAGPEYEVADAFGTDAATGDEVVLRVLRKPGRGHGAGLGEVVQITTRATRQFVGSYFEKGGQGYVRVAGTVFSQSVHVGDPGAKGAKPEDQVVIEMVRFPTPSERGEGVIIEVLGRRGQPGVDTLSVMRAYNLPEAFPEEVLAEARHQAALFNPQDLGDRADFTHELVITIDPIDARDFDDAISLTFDSTRGHWLLGVHIADVGHFAPPGSALDREARKRATSVYLPQRVIPMFPELISNGLASLQAGQVRFVKSVVIDFNPAGIRTGATFYNAAIKARRRFTYEQVQTILNDFEAAKSFTGEPTPTHPGQVEPEVLALLRRMRDLALILRKRRLQRGALELEMPEAKLEFDEAGQVTGARFAVHDLSHRIIEEFMLSANEAVADFLTSHDVPFLRRIHPAPDEEKLYAFADFARTLGYRVDNALDRHTLQRVLRESAEKPERAALHYAMLRSLKQATYSPEQEEHYALAGKDYCHFTSPIRRYPDLVIHRLIGQWLKNGRASADPVELAGLGDHCSKLERRAEAAERELIRLKILLYLSERIGLTLDAIITGVADYGFFCLAEQLPVEGLVHISSLSDDYYNYDETEHTLFGRRTKNRYRLGDRVRVEVVHVDVDRRQLDLRLLKSRRSERG